jgi:heterodisulfide reductase subunit A
MVRRWENRKHLHFLNFTTMIKDTVIVGAGVAGLTAAASLEQLGAKVMVIEKENQTGGHVRNWDRLFPDRRPASDVLNFLETGINDRIAVKTGLAVVRISPEQNNYIVHLANGETIKTRSVVIAAGFTLFDAMKKEEYGYGIYENVITAAELEQKFLSGKVLMTSSGKSPRRVAFIHCVGSRDEKVGNLYCSKVCCVTGVKQAIEVREIIPDCEVFCFYMDLRMFDRYFEELYLEAQQKWRVSFIRGRLSECAENPDHSLIIKTEDTLTGKPLKMNVDMVVLLTGFCPAKGIPALLEPLGVQFSEDRFIRSHDGLLDRNATGIPGLFLAGTVKGPAGIPETMSDARSASISVWNYLKNSEKTPI